MQDWVFVTGSGLLSVSIALNAVSTHGTCTAVFVVVAAVVAICLNSIRTLGRITILAWVGLFSIIAASRFIIALSDTSGS